MLAASICHNLNETIHDHGLAQAEQLISRQLDRVAVHLNGENIVVPLKQQFAKATENFFTTILTGMPLPARPDVSLNVQDRAEIFKKPDQSVRNAFANNFFSTVHTDFWIKEASRLTQDRIMLIERFPLEDQPEKDADFMAAYLLNRLIHGSPYPISLKTEKEWEAAFKPHGWQKTEARFLGEDPTGNKLHLMVLGRT